MASTAEVNDSRTPVRRHVKLFARLVFWLGFAFVLYAIFAPSAVINHVPGKRAKSHALLNVLINASTTYQSTYHTWPMTQPVQSSQDSVVLLKTHSPEFIAIMSGYSTADAGKFNEQGLVFIQLHDEQLSSDGRHIVDAYGNDDIVLMFDSDGDGQIAPLTVTISAKNGKAVTLRQTRPVRHRAIAMSPGDGKTIESAITTWEVSPE